MNRETWAVIFASIATVAVVALTAWIVGGTPY